MYFHLWLLFQFLLLYPSLVTSSFTSWAPTLKAARPATKHIVNKILYILSPLILKLQNPSPQSFTGWRVLQVYTPLLRRGATPGIDTLTPVILG